MRLVEGMSARRQCAGISTEQYGKMSRRRCCFKLQAGLSAIQKGGGRMTGIVVVFPRLEDAKGIRNLLVRSGFLVHAVCTTGAQAIGALEDLNDGIVICGYRMTDMIYTELHDCLPEGFDMLFMASQAVLNEYRRDDIVSLAMPLKVHDLINTVDMMSQTIMRRRRRAKARPKERNAGEEALVREAKEVLISRNHMTEEEAHRYIQKCSMDSGTNMVETAQMILAMMRG